MGLRRGAPYQQDVMMLKFDMVHVTVSPAESAIMANMSPRRGPRLVA
jgi:hypothetical protein